MLRFDLESLQTERLQTCCSVILLTPEAKFPICSLQLLVDGASIEAAKPAKKQHR